MILVPEPMNFKQDGIFHVHNFIISLKNATFLKSIVNTSWLKPALNIAPIY